MPLLADGMLVQTVIAFITIAVFALILRWTFGRDRQRTPPFPEPESGTPGAGTPGAGAPGAGADGDQADTGPPDELLADSRRAATWGADFRRSDAPGAQPSTDRPGVAETDDFGLLAIVAKAETAAEAASMRKQLRHAGIRATTAHGADGRFRVLVFSAEAHRARRIVRSGGNPGRG